MHGGMNLRVEANLTRLRGRDDWPLAVAGVGRTSDSPAVRIRTSLTPHMISQRSGMPETNTSLTTNTSNGSKTRIEKDLLGELAVPADAYYGVQTARALENFKISGVELRLYPNFIKGFAMVKLAAARANYETGGFSKEILDAIEGACHEIIAGKLHDEFRLDVLQGGAGTSTNMNANEVIANRALELMGHQKGEYKYCDPHDHVNRSQSTNDSYPTSMHIGMALGNGEVVAAFNKLIDAFRAKGEEFNSILKMGRTQLQDAVP